MNTYATTCCNPIQLLGWRRRLCRSC